jgi:hypothetical protein
VNFGKVCYRYSASSQALLENKFLFGFDFDTAFSIMVGPFVKVVQNYSEITFDALLIEDAIINENNTLSFSNNPLVTFLYTSFVML